MAAQSQWQGKRNISQSMTIMTLDYDCPGIGRRQNNLYWRQYDSNQLLSHSVDHV